MNKKIRSKVSEADPQLPGQVVLSELGLAPTVAGLREKFPTLQKSTVWRWSQSRDVGGTDGLVPSLYHLPLMQLARRLGKQLTSDDLVMGRGN